MYNLTNINVELTEPCFNFNGLLPVKSPPAYWKHLGSSKTRTADQAQQGKEEIRKQIAELQTNSAIAFTDGSCMENPGPCGAGAIIYHEDKSVELQQPVSKRASILLGELIAIKLVLDHIDTAEFSNLEQLKIFSDSQQSIGILTLNWKTQNYHSVVQEIITKLNLLKRTGLHIQLEWTPGHADIAGNEIADKLAKSAAKEAQEQDQSTTSIVSKQDIITASKKSAKQKWQRQWNNSEKGRTFHKYQKSVENIPKLDYPNKYIYSIITGLRSGYTRLNQYKHMIGIIDSPNCECGHVEDVEHYLLNCQKHEEQREKLRTDFFFLTGNLILDMDALLMYGEEDQYHTNRDNITSLLADYIRNTNRFII